MRGGNLGRKMLLKAFLLSDRYSRLMTDMSRQGSRYGVTGLPEYDNRWIHLKLQILIPGGLFSSDQTTF